MSCRQMLNCTIVLGIFLASAALAYAEKSHDGKVVSVSEGKGSTNGELVMTDKDGKGEHSHAISSTVKITRNSKTSKLGDLKKGDAITVTTADNGQVTAVSATEGGATRRSTDSAVESDMPDILKDLKLSADQQSKINDIVKKYDDECESTWKEFSNRYQKTIRLEASMLAAIEEHFTDGQRKQLREQRSRAARKRNDEQKSDGKAGGEAASNTSEEEIVIIGITLSPDQQDKAQRVRRRFIDRLGALNEQIEELHAKLISLETEKLLDIEDVLTRDQREQLRKDHEKLTRSTDESSGKPSTK